MSLTLGDFPAALSGRPHRPEAAHRRQPDQGRVRRLDQRQAHPQDRRHARRRRRLDARCADLGRTAAAARRRLRPLRDQGADQCDGRHHRSLERQCRTRRQHRRGRAHLRHRRAQDAARHARLRHARSDALCLHRPPAHRQSARMEQHAHHARRSLRHRFRPAAVGGERGDVQRQARPHRHRRQLARRSSGGDRRRGAGLWRRDQGLADAGQFRSRRRRQIAAAIHRRRSGKLPRPVVRAAPARRQGQHIASRSKAPATACSRSPAP